MNTIQKRAKMKIVKPKRNGMEKQNISSTRRLKKLFSKKKKCSKSRKKDKMLRKPVDRPKTDISRTNGDEINNSSAPTLNLRKKKRTVYICTAACNYEAVRRVAAEKGLVENVDQWNVLWTDMFISVDKYLGLKANQRINHFPGMIEICRKDLLAKKLISMSNRFPNEYRFFPKTWTLPNDLIQATNYSKLYRNKVFIVKPCFGSKGRGIQLTRDLKNIKNLDHTVCQLYIYRPFLIDGYKQDFRVYALLTSCDPLRLYVYNEGIVRFATKKYEDPEEINFNDRFMHLTNYSVNRRNSMFNVDGDEGSKRKSSTVNAWLKNNGHDVTKIWESIDDSIVKTVLMVVPTLKYCYKLCFPRHEASQACFELLGFDFILNRKMIPYLLEVNHSPSFHCHTPVDFDVKSSLLNDTFVILDLNRSNEKMHPPFKMYDNVLNTHAKTKLEAFEKRREQDAIKARIDWENGHMGNYRLVYPGKNPDKYKHFLNKKQRAVQNKMKSKCLDEAVLGNDLTSAGSRKNPFPFVNEIPKMDRRAGQAVVRNFLLQSHGLLNNVYNDIKTASQRRFIDEIRLSRENEWNYEGEMTKQYAEQRDQFTEKVSIALCSISKKPELKIIDKEMLSSLLLNPPILGPRDPLERCSHLGPIVTEPY